MLNSLNNTAKNCVNDAVRSTNMRSFCDFRLGVPAADVEYEYTGFEYECNGSLRVQAHSKLLKSARALQQSKGLVTLGIHDYGRGPPDCSCRIGCRDSYYIPSAAL
jgi:hypothetical protein